MTVLLVLCSSVILTACAPAVKTNGGVVPDEAVLPVSQPLMESQVAGYIEDLRSETSQCKANFQ